MFNVLCSDKIQNCAENPAPLEQFLRVIWEAGFQATPQFDSNKTLSYSYYCLLIIFINSHMGSKWTWIQVYLILWSVHLVLYSVFLLKQYAVVNEKQKDSYKFFVAFQKKGHIWSPTQSENGKRT